MRIDVKGWGMLVALALLTSCGSMDKKTCEVGDWAQYGKVDARQGRLKDYWKKHQRSCSEFDAQVDVSAYEAGWNQGLAEFCQPESAYAHGAKGKEYFGQCATLAEADFKKHFETGRKVYLLKKSRQELDQQLNKMAEQKPTESSGGGVVGAIVGLINTTAQESRRGEVNRERAKVTEQIYELESQAPVVSLSQDEVTPSMWRSVGGTLTGMVVGFGSGHAIQGRYKEKGWIFTLGEGVAIGGMIASASQCETTQAETQVGGTAIQTQVNRECGGALPLVSLLGFVGMRLWQVIDLISHTGQVSNGYLEARSEARSLPTWNWGVYLAKNDATPSLGMNWNW